MIVRLFDIQNKVVVPTEHCYTLKDLRFIMDNYPDDYMKRYLYLFYMTCPDPDNNPFFFLPESSKESTIAKQIQMDFSAEDDGMLEALDLCTKLYSTPTSRAYEGIKVMLDNLSVAMKEPITTGRDGNGPFLLSAAEKFDRVRESYKGVLKDLKEEQHSKAKGNAGLAYDG